jgi:DNA-binding NarL/FixJ family response regulator
LQPKRVLLIDMPLMLREMFRRALARDARFALVGEYTKSVALDVAIDRSRADYVVMGTGMFEESDVLARVLEEGPQVRVLAVRPGGGQAFLYELRPHEQDLGDLTPEELLERIVRTQPEEVRE